MQLTGRSDPTSARALTADGGQWNIGLCGREHDRLQLICRSSYFDNDNKRFRVTLGPRAFVNVPTGIDVFANTFVDEGTPPREWAERLYNVRR